MWGQRIGSVCVSTVDQHPERYLEQVQVDRVSTDTASGKETTRPALAALRTFVREGDTVVVHRMDRLPAPATICDGWCSTWCPPCTTEGERPDDGQQVHDSPATAHPSYRPRPRGHACPHGRACPDHGAGRSRGGLRGHQRCGRHLYGPGGRRGGDHD